MPPGSCRSRPAPSRRARRVALAALAGAALHGLLPAASARTVAHERPAAAGAVWVPAWVCTAVRAAGTVAHEGHGTAPPAPALAWAPPALARATPTPQVSMSPHPPTEVQAGPTLKRVLEQLLCQCGCNLTVYACEGTMTCEVAAGMRRQAERLLARGMTPDEVLAAFAADYGEDVLAAPTREGFNLTAWVLPFAVLAGGGLVVALALRSWRPRGGEPEEVPSAAIDPTLLEEVEREVRREG